MSRTKESSQQQNLEHTGIRLNAIQTFCLLLIFGDIMPDGNTYWRLLLLLLQVPSIVFSLVISLINQSFQRAVPTKQLDTQTPLHDLLFHSHTKNWPNSSLLANQI